MIKRFLKAFKREKYPHTNEHGWKMRIIGDGVIELDVDSIVKSDRFKEHLRHIENIRTRGQTG